MNKPAEEIDRHIGRLVALVSFLELDAEIMGDEQELDIECKEIILPRYPREERDE